MSIITMKKADGSDGATVELPDDIFGIEPNVGVMHQVVTAQLAAKRSGTHSTKTRAQVRGGGAKPWRQKGTGRARQGSIRAPQWRGGGVAHGPHPRDYTQRTPKKMVRLAVRSALSDRASENKVIVVDDWALNAPSTKAGVQLLSALGLRNIRKESGAQTPEPAEGEKRRTNHGGFVRNPRVLVVLFRTEETAWKSLRNLGERVQILLPEELNTYDVLLNDWIVFSQPSLEAIVARLSDGAEASDESSEVAAP
jgi:large subunit ribosomal protein L4